MKCEEALLLISGQIDGTNTDEEMALLREHLASCPDCRRTMEVLTQIEQEIAGLEEESPASLKTNVMNAIRAEARPKRRARRWAPIAVAAALVVVVGMTQFGQLNRANLAAPASIEASERSVAYSRSVTEVSAQIVDSQRLADELGGDVAVARDLLPEMEVCSCETLEDGTLLYLLDCAETAAELSEKYGLELYRPSVALGDRSYARLMP